jgi:hypothetical protein
VDDCRYLTPWILSVCLYAGISTTSTCMSLHRCYLYEYHHCVSLHWCYLHEYHQCVSLHWCYLHEYHQCVFTQVLSLWAPSLSLYDGAHRDSTSVNTGAISMSTIIVSLHWCYLYEHHHCVFTLVLSLWAPSVCPSLCLYTGAISMSTISVSLHWCYLYE